MNLWTSLAGKLTVELVSSQPEVFFRTANTMGISLFQMEQADDLTYRFHIRRGDWQRLNTLAKKRDDKLTILHRHGLYWKIHALLCRPLLLFGITVIFLLTLLLPTRVLFVSVEGNVRIPDREILEAAEASGIHFLASRRAVRSEQVKNALLAAVPELQWAGVNTAGCTAVISVRERTAQEPSASGQIVSNIVASRDGFILSATAVQGSAMVQPGQIVQKGQVLISGYTDCGICIQAARAQGEVYAQTIRSHTVITPDTYTQRRELTGIRRSYSILIGKKRINLWKDSGISDASCGRMYEEYALTLPGGFVLPLSLCVQTDFTYDVQETQVSADGAAQALEAYAVQYLQEHMVAGKIASRSQSITHPEGVYRLDGVYVCEEMIGREQAEQIGETHGKTS